MITSPYLECLLDISKRKKIILGIIENLEYLISSNELVFDSVAFCGMSGALIAPEIAARFNKQLILVRKERSKHSPVLVEGNLDCKNYIILDDSVFLGETVKYIIDTILNFEYNPNNEIYLASREDVKCVGVVIVGKSNLSKINEIKVYELNLVKY